MLSRLLAATAICAVFGSILLVDGEVFAQSSNSQIVGQIVDQVLLRGIEDVHLDGDYAYLPCREGKRLTICSIEDPASPTVVSSFTHAELGQVAGLASGGNMLYLASQDTQRLLVVDASDKTALRLLGSVVIGEPGQGTLYKVAYRDGYCYVANQSEKMLFVVDVRNPSEPVVVGSVVVTVEDDGPFSVLLREDYALVGTIFGHRNRLAVIDVESPTEPSLVASVFGPEVGHTSGEIVDTTFFAVNWDKNALLVFDVTDPAKPTLQAKLVDERLGKPNRCVVAGDRAYLPMTKGDGVAVVDISDPLNPKFLTAFQDPVMKKTYGLAVRGDLLFVGSREGNSLVVLNRHALENI